MEVTGAKATIVDYLPFSHGAVGTAFAYWVAPAYIQAEGPMAAAASTSQSRTRTAAPAV